MAKTNRTIIELLDNLNEELSWRRRELNFIKNKIDKDVSEAQKTLIRACVTMLYAHWEGFIKNVTEAYLNFVSLKKLTHKQLKSCFVAISIRKKFDLMKSNYFENQASAIEFLFDELDKRAFIPYKNVINTKSNLNFGILKDICCVIGIDSLKYSLKKVFIDEKLLNNRNNIAHGNYLAIDFGEFEVIFRTTLNLMESIRDDIIEAAEKELYKRI